MRLKLIIAKILQFIPDDIYSKCMYFLYQKKLPNINGNNFSEKLLRKKCGLLSQSEKQLREVIADRLLVRDYVESLNTDVKLIPLLWSGKSISQAIWDELPNKFVIKARHGSQMVLIVDKSTHNFVDVFAKTEEWKKIDYYLFGREWVYKNTPRELVVEEFISFESDIPPDYKFFCLNSQVELVQVDLGRFSSHKRNLYNRSFEGLEVTFKYQAGKTIAKPSLYDKAVLIAESLARDLDFIRVDLYILEDEIYFGELTNFPENCLVSFSPQSFDLELGQKMRLKND
ncbi:hypothetical protein C7Y70_15200 [Pseudoalteromonas sp. KS88]|uniref:ATP-grasp fold amidoligase family protein n=1 Tax=Pseudoalteromonas sp. KS88 TaxID=2109918 RepID=UPI001081380C|nr:ATP-grasp fold amidoligase family protein [Pseudoalteromonas sp. KS88]TGE79854.1 hypothetical protein C7Y70_15200 [Pseudoalteromonas sp. KS88]